MNLSAVLLYVASFIVGGYGYHYGVHHETKDENPIVETTLGKYQGTLMETRLGKTLYAFRGIRYAKPPVNDLRFQPPVAIDKHEGIYDATKDKPLCPQITTDPIDEDCLILNVYTTKIPNKHTKVKRPVIVYLHPIGFYGGGSASYLVGPQYMTDQDVVLVTFNYRLATLGFLSTGDKHAPGNNGLKDQVQVLRWIQQNIEGFGGDKDSVTLQGYSAGSISVILHMMSPMSKGLFHRGIAMSASPTAQWPIGNDLMVLARKQARLVGCPSNETTEIMVKCLKTIPFKQLAESQRGYGEFGFNPVLIWTPVIEPDVGIERFLTDQPVNLIRNKKFQQIPLITGVTKDEFSWKIFQILDNKTLSKQLEENWEVNAPIVFQYERGTEVSKRASRELRKFYIGDSRITKNQKTIIGLGNMYSEGLVGFGINRAAKLISQYSEKPVYYYRFSYPGRYSYYYTPESNNTKPYGVVHHDDTIYLVYNSKLFPKFEATSPIEVEMVEKLTKLHANFATHGNPTPTASNELDNVTWEQFTKQNLKYLDIGKKLEMKERLYEDRYNIWDRLFPLDHFTNNNQEKNCYLETCP